MGGVMPDKCAGSQRLQGFRALIGFPIAATDLKAQLQQYFGDGRQPGAANAHKMDAMTGALFFGEGEECCPVHHHYFLTRKMSITPTSTAQKMGGVT